MKRGCGVLLHVSSLPTGDFRSAFEFIDFLHAGGVKYWQVLPLSPTGYGDSPYSPLSVFAGNPKFIDRKKAADVTGLAKFIKDNKFWVESYALYRVIKKSQGERAFLEWDEELRDPQSAVVKGFSVVNADKIKNVIIEQMQFYEQWAEIKNYANERGIQIIGDLPIYAAMDSADVWANRNQFDFTDGLPTAVAGVGADYFNSKGQFWGNPLYNFRQMGRDKYKWWLERLKQMQKMFDILRIDHFRAFDTYYKIPYGAQSALEGAWHKGPGMKFFNAVKAAMPNVKIILEDLGMLTKSVHKLREASGYPGMRVMQFGFGGDLTNEHLPTNYIKNCVAYIGTHDNDTTMGFLQSADAKTRGYVDEYLHSEGLGAKDVVRLAMEDILASPADIVILSMQDLLFQDTCHRMNTPGTVDGNWKYKTTAANFSPKTSNYLKILIDHSGR